MPSKTGYLQRYLMIIQQVRRKKFISMNELIDAVQHRISLYEDRDKIGISKSTIQRDLKDIRKKLYLNIKYSKTENGYFIHDDDRTSDIEMMLEPLNLLGTLYLDKNLPNFVFAEKRKPRGMENLTPLIYAIKNSLITEFLYLKFDNSSQHTRIVEPYALKEFRGRWYLLAVETEEQRCIKTWGLDRIQDLYIH